MKKFVYVISLLIVLSMMLMTFSPVVAARPTGTWRSGIACQNLDAVNDSTVVLTFYPEGSGTAAVSYNSTILAGQSKNWVTTSSTSMPNFPSPFTGAGVVSSSTPIACNVNTEIQGATGSTTNPYRSGTSQGFSDSAAAVKLYAPQVMREYYNYNSYVSVQNTGGASVTVNVKYFDASTGNEVTAAAESASIPAQSSKVFYQTDNAALGNFIGAATIEAADGTTKLAAIVNIYNNAELLMLICHSGVKWCFVGRFGLPTRPSPTPKNFFSETDFIKFYNCRSEFKDDISNDISIVVFL